MSQNAYAASDAFAATLAEEATRHLVALLKLDTTSPPGHERLAADYIAGELAKEGIEATIIESAPTRANLVARLKAEHPTGRPILLMGHTDVVSVERDKWEHDPFGGEVIDGYVWGRGALDMKSMVAGELAVFIALKRAGIPLVRDVILAAFADEEVSGELGAKFMYDHHREVIDAEFALNEGGGYPVTVSGTSFYSCGTGEKGQSLLRVTFRGKPGHASTPLPDTAMAKLGKALVLLHEWTPDFAITTPVRRTLEGLAALQSGETRQRLEAILASDAPAWEDLAPVLAGEREQLSFWALTHNTAVPTLVEAGQRINVIPSEVVLDIDCRILPGTTPEAWRDQVQGVVGDLGEVTLLTRNPGIGFDPESAFFDAIRQTLGELVPGATVLPGLIGGRTDAAHMPEIKVYGFYPLLPGERLAIYTGLAHGHNERVHVDDVALGARFTWNLVTAFATT